MSGCCSRCRARLAHVWSSAVLVLAERTINCEGLDSPDGSMGGASSRIRCALVPPMPNELTPARHGCPLVHSASSVLTRNGLSAKLISGLGCAKCKLGG